MKTKQKKELDPFKPKGTGFNWALGYNTTDVTDKKRSERIEYSYKFAGVKSLQIQSTLRSTESWI